MLGGQLLGRITSVSGTMGFVPYFRHQVTVNYQNTQNPSTILDVVNLVGAVYVSYAKDGFVAQNGIGDYIGPAYFDSFGTFGVLAGNATAWTFRVHANHGLLHRIEQNRNGRDVIVRLEITVAAVSRGTPTQLGLAAFAHVNDANSPGSAYCSYEIPKSKWHELLKAVGYGEFHLAEIPLPRIKKTKTVAPSLQHLQRAWEHFLNGSDRETLAACHDALEKLARESLNPHSKPDQNAFASMLSSVGHPEKVKSLAQVFNNCAALLHLGRHEHKPAVELDHRDAELAILLTHACLAYLSKMEPAKQRPASKKAATSSMSTE